MIMDEGRMMRIESKLDGIHRDVSKINSELTGLSRDVNHWSNCVGTMKQDLDSIHSEIELIQRDMTNTHTKLKTIYTAIVIFGGILLWVLRETGVLTRIFRIYYGL